VFAAHLEKAGAEVTFAVRSPEKVHPVALTRLGVFGPKPPQSFSARAVVRECGASRFDLVILTVPSDALDSAWLRALVPGFEGATVVGLQPGVEDRSRLLGLGIPESRFVRGLIGFISFATPLSAADRLPAGYAYWCPPFSPCAFDGPPELVGMVVATLRAGRLPSTRKPGLESEVTFFTAGLLVTVRALERAGWSLDALASDPSLSVQASAEALAITARRLMRPVPLGPALTTRPWLVSTGARLAPLVVPFDVETYLRVHFTKVAPQSKFLLGDLVAMGRSYALPVDALEKLLASM
jgi:2-dehydropantoate 2-reductase